jgi:hypothetical protein
MLPLKQGLLCGLGLVLLFQQGTSQNWDGPSSYPDRVAPNVIVEDGGNSAYPLSEVINTDYPTTIDGNDDVSDGEDSTGLATRDAKDFYLRIMPLGASITEGVESSDQNGYRKLLRQQLRWKGWKVNMVGTKNDGTMSDNVRCPASDLVSTMLTGSRITRDILAGSSTVCMMNGVSRQSMD